MRTASILLLVLLAAGCSYKTPVQVAPAINVYSSYDTKIPGSVVLVVDGNLKNISRQLKPSSYECSAHKYPVEIESAFASSLKSTTESIFENVVEMSNYPTVEEMKANNVKGYIGIKLNRFDPKIRFMMGFWSANAIATSEVAFDIVVKDSENKTLMSTSVGASRTVEGSGGGACGGGAQVLSDAIYQSTKEAMERYAERISNSQQIRDKFK
jgi:hypothetical protein